MHGVRIMTYAPGCTGKTRYSSGAKARAALTGLRKYAPRRGDRGKPRRPYHCNHCNGWHLTGQDSYEGEG